MRPFAGLLLFLFWGTSGFGYSVLSHEAIIDALWETKLRALLIARFPQTTPAQLHEAHSYAYGGAIIQDMGYYPNANGYFSDLTHYVRSADFIQALLSDAETVDEYSFALGALSHYASDNDGHRMATNVGEPLLYPKLARKYGSVVTYDNNPTTHLQTEYAFDVEEVAKGNYAPPGYHDFIGFNVSKTLLERAFRETYGFDLRQVISNLDLAIGSYRHTLSTLIPFFTRIAWANHQSQIQRSRPGATKRQFLYAIHRSSYEQEWGRQYSRPSLLDHTIAFVIRLLPPIGRVRVLKFRALTPEVEQLFMKSFDQASKDYAAELNHLGENQLPIENTNFDLGQVTSPGNYPLQDQTYAYWLDQTAKSKFSGITPEMKQELLQYFQNPDVAIGRKIKQRERQRLMAEVEQLQQVSEQAQNTSFNPN